MARTPTLGDVVLAGEGAQSAMSITPFIHGSVDVSNSYLVQTDDGNVLINAGTAGGGPRHAAAYAALGGPLRYAILTQSHVDHFGGLSALREPDTVLVAQSAFPKVRAYWLGLAPFYGRRTMHLWGSILGPQPAVPPPEVQPDILFDDEMEISVGGRHFTLLSTPGGETLDSCVVWLPDDGAIFTGNLFGPIFRNLPNLYTIRGDRARSVETFLTSLDRVRACDAELLITGHGEPIRGSAVIRADLDRIADAVDYLRTETWKGMNAGRSLHELMRDIALPPRLRIGEQHGKTAWAVRAIWEEYAGWFHFRSTTELFDVPASSVSGDLVNLAGGPAPLIARARDYLDKARPLEALHLLETVLDAAPGDATALSAKRDALAVMLDRASDNLSEIMWLKAEIAGIEAALAASGGEIS